MGEGAQPADAPASAVPAEGEGAGDATPAAHDAA
jgi:hypothetical protein